MRKIMFTKSKLEYIGSASLWWRGRNCEDALRKNDTLRVECDGITDSVNVIVDEITMYGRTVPEVDPGLTAGLHFEANLASYFALGGKLSGIQE